MHFPIERGRFVRGGEKEEGGVASASEEKGKRKQEARKIRDLKKSKTAFLGREKKKGAASKG